MIRRGGAALLFATAVAAMAQMADTMLSSRQVATDARPVITGSNLTEVAESRRHFETNVPPGVASKAQAESAVALAFSVGFSNAVVSAVEDGGGLRFSVTGRYDFVEGATVSVDNVVLKKDAAATIGSMDADQVYAGSLSTPLLLADVLDASVSAPLGTIASPLIESSGVLNAGSVVVSNLQAGSLSVDVVVPGGGPVEVYEELGRRSSYVKTATVSNESWSIVPPPKYGESVFTDSVRVVADTVAVPVTNIWPVVYEAWITNWCDVVHFTNANGAVTNIAWEAVVTNQPGDVAETNLAYFAYEVSGSPPATNYLFETSVYVFTNGLGEVTTNLPYAVAYETHGMPPYTNIVEVPVYTYTDATTTWTNPAPSRIPDTGPVGVCTTSMVLRVFPPGVLHTNASGRVYIHEPAAIKPAGSGTEDDPFIMTRPENFRWVREEHKPGGLVQPRDVRAGGYGYFYRADGSSNFGPGESASSYFATAPLSVVTNMGVYSTWCTQANDIDMIDTYLWSDNRWKNGEYVDGFGGISGPGKITFFPRVADKLDSSYFTGAFSAPSATNLCTFGGLNYYLSRYAMFAWPNQCLSQRIIYDGGNHSLSGIWVGINSDASHQTAGLLGSVVAFPRITNLSVSGRISGTVPVHELDNNSTIVDGFKTSGVSIGGLFGSVDHAVSPGLWRIVYGNTWFPSVVTNRYNMLRELDKFSLEPMVSNCVVFCDVDVSITTTKGIDETAPVASSRNVFVGGAFGKVGKQVRWLSGWLGNSYPLHSRQFGLLFYNSSFVGARRIDYGIRGGISSANRLVGHFAYAGEFISTVNSEPANDSYVQFGLGHRIDDCLFLNNTCVTKRMRSDLPVTGPSFFKDLFYQVHRSMDGFHDGSLVRPYYTGYLGTKWLASDPNSYSYYLNTAKVPREELDLSKLRAGRVGYYGNMFLSDDGAHSGDYAFPTIMAMLIGEYGGHLRQYNIFVPEGTGYSSVAGYDCVRMHLNISDLSKCRSYLGFEGGLSWDDAATLRFAGASNTVVIAASSLDSETHGTGLPSTFSNYSIGDGVSISSAAAMTKKYLVEPENELGYGGRAVDPKSPYLTWYDEGWTRSGELDGFYPVPAGAAGVSVKETATVVETRPPGSVVDTGDVRVFSGSNDVITTSVREVDMAFTNRYAVDATYLSPTSCLLTVVNQVYQRHSKETRTDIERVSSVVSNRVASYSGAVTVDAGLYSTGDVSVEGSVQRIGANSLNPYAFAGSGEALGNDLGTVRVYPGVSTNPVALAPWLDFSDGSLSFVSNAAPVHFEWWPDYAPASQSNLVVMHNGVPVSGGFNYCEPADGDAFTFDAPAPGFIVVKPGHPTDGLVAAGSLSPPDLRHLCTNGVYETPVAPVAWYKFDGDYLDSTTNALHGSLGTSAGAVVFTNGVFGQAVFFPYKGLLHGSGRGIVVADAGGVFGGTSELTVSFWALRSMFVSETAGLVSYARYNSAFGRSWAVTDDFTRTYGGGDEIYDRAALSLWTYNGTKPVLNRKFYPRESYLDNRWTHFAFVFDNGYVSLYADGSLVELYTVGFSVLPSLHPSDSILNIGSYTVSYNTGRQMVGAVDDVRIFRAPLQADAISDAMSGKTNIVRRSYPATNAVFQASFVSSPLGAPYMAPLPSSMWSRQDFHHAAALPGGIRGDAAYIDGLNHAYPATLRVDIDNPSGAALRDDEFFASVRVYCNYSDPAYLLPDGPHHPRTTRTSATEGFMEYDIVATQLVVLQARGDLGAMATATLLPKEWPYEED